uniref:Uncharacterized protein n=1 Tax=Arundo donax TaxID=35708 RepID=A0A0A9EED3_ARUDO
MWHASLLLKRTWHATLVPLIFFFCNTSLIVSEYELISCHIGRSMQSSKTLSARLSMKHMS